MGFPVLLVAWPAHQWGPIAARKRPSLKTSVVTRKPRSLFGNLDRHPKSSISPSRRRAPFTISHSEAISAQEPCASRAHPQFDLGRLRPVRCQRGPERCPGLRDRCRGAAGEAGIPGVLGGRPSDEHGPPSGDGELRADQLAEGDPARHRAVRRRRRIRRRRRRGAITACCLSGHRCR